jgi:hypothetical protein
MKKQKHTKGPWSFASTNPSQYLNGNPIEWDILDQYSCVVATTNNSTSDADARLIASAPEMLEALRNLTHPMASDEDLQNALAVIAKAEGRDS